MYFKYVKVPTLWDNKRHHLVLNKRCLIFDPPYMGTSTMTTYLLYYY